MSIPLSSLYFQQMGSSLQGELDFCKSRSGNIWQEVTRTQVLSAPSRGPRSTRAASTSGAGPPPTVLLAEPCQTCEAPIHGQPGPRGPPGSDGKEGEPGIDGDGGPR
uniref:Nematode cuticle collagen N-terminal domain-containing protein n=1 Tax=Meloidogyne floridensis TaxID=298350 RepID=A0A915PEJ9_9BILA